MEVAEEQVPNNSLVTAELLQYKPLIGMPGGPGVAALDIHILSSENVNNMANFTKDKVGQNITVLASVSTGIGPHGEPGVSLLSPADVGKIIKGYVRYDYEPDTYSEPETHQPVRLEYVMDLVTGTVAWLKANWKWLTVVGVSLGVIIVLARRR